MVAPVRSYLTEVTDLDTMTSQRATKFSRLVQSRISERIAETVRNIDMQVRRNSYKL
jgi:hypothetical protein